MRIAIFFVFLVYVGVALGLVVNRSVPDAGLAALGASMLSLVVYHQRSCKAPLRPLLIASIGQMAIGILVILFALAGCSSGDAAADEMTKASAFVGKWQFKDGAFSAQCEDGSKLNEPLAGGIDEFRLGTDEYLVRFEDGCEVRFQIDGTTASALPGQVCAKKEDGVDLRLTLVSDVYVLEGTAMTERSAGTMTIGKLKCDFSVSGTLTKSI
jgi:hypothetical protein